MDPNLYEKRDEASKSKQAVENATENKEAA